MKLSAISEYLTQTEAAILVILAEKIMLEAEIAAEQNNSTTRAKALEAADTAYCLRCVAEQSMRNNDGVISTTKQKVLDSAVVKEGWINTAADVMEWEKESQTLQSEQLRQQTEGE